MKGITGNPALDAYQRFAVKSVSQTHRSNSTTDAAHKPRATEAAKVNISSQAQELASGAPDINLKKVEALQASIADGTYSVDSSKVAQLMLENGGA